ncbi:MAG: hypothetical protein J5793_04010, partial [Clostridia bacterium]|nr:hypothetical protein [Clostridia bacterium]
DLQTLRDGDMNEITDAGVCHVGGKRFFFGAFRKTAYLFDVCGNRLAKLFNTPEGARLTDFLPVTPEFYAACFEQNRMRFVFVNDNGKESRATVPPGSSLRMLFAGEDGIYALFGTNYIYNRITRIYSSGVLDLTPACDT